MGKTKVKKVATEGDDQAAPKLPARSDDEQFLQDAAKRIKERLTYTNQAIAEIGRDLIAVKNRIKYGDFQHWISIEFSMSLKTAERFMSVAETYGERIDIVTILNALSATVLYELAAPSTPEEVRTIVEERVTSGETPTLPEVRELKKLLQGFREELRRIVAVDKVETYKAALISIWNVTPQEVREWFFEEHGPRAQATGDASVQPMEGGGE